MPTSTSLHLNARVSALALFIVSALAFVPAATGAAYGQRSVVPLDDLTSDPAVAEFLPKYNTFLLDRNFAAATSEALIVLAKHPDNRDAQIAGTCGWAFASLAAHQHGPVADRKMTACTATERLKGCLAMIEKRPSEERQKKYITLQAWIGICLTSSLCDAGSYTLALQTVEDFFARDSDNVACGAAASVVCASFPEVPDKEALISSLKGLVRRYKGKPGSAHVLWDLARIFDKRGDEAGFRSVLETMEADFPLDNTYRLALRRLAIQRAAGKRVIPPKKDASTTGGSGQPDPRAGCGCGCGGTTATATAVKPQPGAAAITKPAAATKVTSGTVAASCCTTGCVTTAVAGTIKRP